MHKISLHYALIGDRSAAPLAADAASHGGTPDLHHPLMTMLDAIHRTGSISGAARALGLSYRHVWGELKRWEVELGGTLVMWVKGQPATLSPFGAKLLWAERHAQARLAPQIEAMRVELQRAFAVAFDDSAGVISISASHDHALPRLRDWVQVHHRLHLDIQFTGSVDALAALNEGRCLLAGFHALTAAPQRSPTARVYRPMLQPGKHKLIGFAQRTQGLMVASGNPLNICALHDLTRPGLRFVHRPRGTGTRVVLEELLAAQQLRPEQISGFDRTEPSHHAAAVVVASGNADAAFGIEVAALDNGLDFVPLAREGYFLVALAAQLDHPHVTTLLRALRTPAWASIIGAIPGYSATGSGEVLSLRAVLPWWRYRTPKRASVTGTDKAQAAHDTPSGR